MKPVYTIVLSMLLLLKVNAQTNKNSVTKKQENDIIKVKESTSARIETVFIIDDSKGLFSGGCELKSGTLKVGQIINVKDDAGKSAQMKITKITDYRKKDDMGRSMDVTLATGATKELFIELETINGGKFSNPSGGFNIGNDSEKTIENKTIIELTGIIDNKNWEASTFFNSCLFYENGNPLLKEKKSILMLAFKTNQLPDNRQLNITLKNYKGQIGNVDNEKFEILLSGSADGVSANAELFSNWENGVANTTKVNFKLEINKWQIEGNEIIVSGIFSGQLFGFNPSKKLSGEKTKKIEFTKASFNNVKVKYFKESYETMEKQINK